MRDPVMKSGGRDQFLGVSGGCTRKTCTSVQQVFKHSPLICDLEIKLVLCEQVHKIREVKNQMENSIYDGY